MKTRFLTALVLVVAVTAGTYVFMYPDAEACAYRNYPIVPLTTPVPPPNRIPPDGLSKYRSEQFRFSLFYPRGMHAQEYPEVGGATTIVFQDPDTLEGFQIFIVPYKNSGIVPRRIEKDVPSGAALNRATTTVDGLCGSMFTTDGSIMPATYEVWVARRGLLFEIATYKGQEDLLESVVSSWRFL
jgi:hypothetical protein